jgi:hypothetical protein
MWAGNFFGSTLDQQPAMTIMVDFERRKQVIASAALTRDKLSDLEGAHPFSPFANDDIQD